MVIRKMLDQAGDVDEAVAILQSYNIEWGSGPPLHYLIADRSGRAVLAEFYQGELYLLPNDQPWHLATNFFAQRRQWKSRRAVLTGMTALSRAFQRRRRNQFNGRHEPFGGGVPAQYAVVDCLRDELRRCDCLHGAPI